MDRDVEKRSTNSGTISPERNEPTFAPIQSTTQATRTRSQASINLSRCQSQNGYSCNPFHNEPSDDELEKDPFEVGWENGDNDISCPRSLDKMRKWVIVTIVASASFCVYVLPSDTSSPEHTHAETTRQNSRQFYLRINL